MTLEKSDVDVMALHNPMFQILKSQIVMYNPWQLLRSQFATSNENLNLRFQFATSSWGGRRMKPYVFTEPCRGDAQNNSPEFEGNKNKAELNRFILSVKQLEDEERLNTPRLEILER